MNPSLELDRAAIDAARRNTGAGAVTPSYGPWAQDVARLLNDALATELVCVLRYRRHHFTARGLASPKIAEELMTHANQELAHADALAERIVQLGADPEFDPESLARRAHSSYDAQGDLEAMLRADLVAERVAIESYRQMISLVGDKDPTTRRMLEAILEVEEEHADEIKEWLA